MRGSVLVAVCLAQLVITLDVSVVNVALPSVREDLGLTTITQQWVVTASLRRLSAGRRPTLRCPRRPGCLRDRIRGVRSGEPARRRCADR